MNPEQPVLLGSGDAIGLHTGGQVDAALEVAVIDLHREHLHGPAFRIVRLRQLTLAADDELTGFTSSRSMADLSTPARSIQMRRQRAQR